MNQPPTVRAGLGSSIISQSLVSASKPNSERVTVHLIFLDLTFISLKMLYLSILHFVQNQEQKVREYFCRDQYQDFSLNLTCTPKTWINSYSLLQWMFPQPTSVKCNVS